MDAEWIRSPAGRLVIAHWADARPAWLWSHDGETLLWRNDAARYFHGRAKKHGIRLAPDPVPIRGQIARLIRLGSLHRPSLSRIQFLAGEKPVSTTCTCTPLALAEGGVALLIVGVDPIEPELLEAREPATTDPLTIGLLPHDAQHLVVSEDGQIAGGSPTALDRLAPIVESEGLPIDGEQGRVELAGDTFVLSRFKASPHESILLLFEPVGTGTERTIESVRHEEGESAEPPTPAEPLLPLGLPPAEQADDEPVLVEEETWVPPLAAPVDPSGALANLFDRLAGDEELYTPLTAEDEHFAGPPPEPVDTPLVPAELADIAPEPAEPPAPDEPADEPPVDTPPEPDLIASLIEYADEAESAVAPAPTTWRIVGRGFTPAMVPVAPSPDANAATDSTDPAEPAEADTPAPVEAEAQVPDADAVERVSRYNFDELSRILTDRVSGQVAAPAIEETETSARPSAEGALINLSGETFILNRLPLGILVFRDQQVLFANRALTDLTGYESIESLRAAGLTAIFPSEDAAAAGPVTQLVRRDGTLAAVNARLQSITWHGRAALMLSASAAENRFGHEAAVRAFAQLAAETNDDGFLSADPTGTITSASLQARIVLGATEEEIVGKPLASFIDPGELGELRLFLDRPARFAETSRPAIMFSGASVGVRLSLFAQGQAGIVTGYFAFLRKHVQSAPPPALAQQAEDVEPSMLARISRSVRRPLNTVIGFSDLIRSSAFGSIENQRYLEYAQDIRSAGQEIATLIDELDDYARLRDGRYPALPDDIDLAELLDTCLVRVRPQAGDARVLVRNAVSEQVPHITADRASLTQAVLNLLASAIDQTPPGGSVILSAHRGDRDSVVINVRDGGEARTDLGERFVVFRDGVGKDGEALQPIRSSVGLALTRSLLAVNELSLSVDPAAGSGNLFTLVVPAGLVRA